MADEEEVIEEEVIEDEQDDTEDDDDGLLFEVADEEELDDDDDEDEEEDEEGEKKSTDESLEELTQIGDKIKSATSHHEQLTKAIKEAQGTLHKIRQEKKAVKSGDEEAVFTDAQLQQILEEHKDEPGVQLQVLKQLMKQGSVEITDSVEKKAEQTAKQKEMDVYLAEGWPELKKEGSEIRLAVDQTREDLSLNDHPYADFLATGAHLLVNVHQLLESAKEEGKAEALKTKVEKNRKKTIKSTKLTDIVKKKGSAKDDELPDSYKETAKQLGFDKRRTKIYTQLVKKGRTLSAEV